MLYFFIPSSCPLFLKIPKLTDNYQFKRVALYTILSTFTLFDGLTRRKVTLFDTFRQIKTTLFDTLG